MVPKRCILVLLLLASARPLHASVIYQASAAPSVFFITEPDETASGIEMTGGTSPRETDIRIGDAITFAGTDRFVTSFSTVVWSFYQPPTPITTDVELTLYQNISGLPGAPIWTGMIPSISIVGTQQTVVTFTPNVTLPDSICFGIAFQNIVQATPRRHFGVAGSEGPGPLAGSSALGVIRQHTATLDWYPEVLGAPGLDQVSAVVQAVPAPGSASAMAMIVALGLRRQSRRPANRDRQRSLS